MITDTRRVDFHGFYQVIEDRLIFVNETAFMQIDGGNAPVVKWNILKTADDDHAIAQSVAASLNNK